MTTAIRRNPTLVILALLLALPGAWAQERGHYPELALTVKPDAIEGPDQLEAGYYTVSVSDESGGLEPDVSVARLADGASEAEVLDAVEALVASMMSGEGAAEAEQRVASLVTLVGGPSQPEGAVLELTPGTYIALSVGATEAGQSHTSLGLHHTFTVTEAASEASAPEADLTVDMLEFAFTIPDEVPAGEQTWEVENVGQQLHHLVLMKLQEGKTMDDVMSFLQSEQGAPPADEAGYVNVLSPGQRNFVTFDLEPGTYVAMCFITDAETGQPHVARGMIKAFTAR